MPRKKRTEKYNYLLDYVKEATDARKSLQAVCERAINAYKQIPLHNTYRENAMRYKQNIANSSASAETIQAVNTICETIPDATNDTVFNATETFVSMAMGGADQFEYLPSDEYMTKDSELVDRLSALAQFFHDDNKINALVPKATRNMVLQGQGCFFLNPLKDGRFKVSLIDAWKKLDDPRAIKTNIKRFEGYTEVTNWASLKEQIYANKKDYSISTINDVDQYLRELTGGFNVWENELRQDLDTFKSIYGTAQVNHSKSVDDNGKEVSPTETGYRGDDVEVAHVWDLLNNLYAVIVNRRFIIKVTEHPFRKTVNVTHRTLDGEKSTPITVEIDSPMVTIPFIEMPNETYPVSPLFYCLDDFDAICSMESVMNHNFSIMAPITFLGTSYDAEQAALLSQVAGQIVEGTMNTLQVMNKQHDMSAIISAIERREQRIKRMMGATDQYELSQMIGNRATAAEASAMSSIVSQRMNNPLANIECGMSELVQKMFAMYIIFAEDDEFTFANDGGVSTVSKQDMLGRSMIRAKLKSQIKIQQQEQSRNALMVLQTLAGAPNVDQEALVSTLVPIITQGVVNRRQAESFISEPQLSPDTVQQLQQLVQQASPEPQLFDQASLQNMTSEDVDMMAQSAQDTIAAANTNAPTTSTTTMNPDAQMIQQAAPTVQTGVDNYQAGLEANNPMNGLI